MTPNWDQPVMLVEPEPIGFTLMCLLVCVLLVLAWPALWLFDRN